MTTIHLNNLAFFAFHGVHEEERILGNQYLVSVELEIDVSEPITELKHTVNYTSLYSLIRQRMGKPTQLLETIAQELMEIIHGSDKRIKSIRINIQKKHPPLAAIEGSVGVTCCKEF